MDRKHILGDFSSHTLNDVIKRFSKFESKEHKLCLSYGYTYCGMHYLTRIIQTNGENL